MIKTQKPGNITYLYTIYTVYLSYIQEYII